MLLQVVLALAAVGHIVVGLSFWFVPELAIEEVLAWGNPSGWTTILGSYDIAIGIGLFLALRDPPAYAGLIRVVAILLVLHAATHAYFNIWGDSPPRLWFPTAYLLLGGMLLWRLGPPAHGLERGQPDAAP